MYLHSISKILQFLPNFDKRSKDQYKKLSSHYQGAYGTSREIPHLMTVDAKSVDFRKAVMGRFLKVQADFEIIREKLTEADGDEL